MIKVFNFEYRVTNIDTAVKIENMSYYTMELHHFPKDKRKRTQLNMVIKPDSFIIIPSCEFDPEMWLVRFV